MNTIRELNIKDWSAYFFEEMVSILELMILTNVQILQ